MSNHITPPKNVSGEVKFVSDPTKQSTGQNIIVEYTYKIKYRDNNINATDIPFNSQPKDIQNIIIQNLLEQGIDIKNKIRIGGVSIGDNVNDEREDKSKPLVFSLSDEEINQYLNPSSSSQNITGITFEVVVENNAGLPTYTYTDSRFTRGKEEQALSIVQDYFSGNDGLNPPTMSVPSADIYTIDSETGEILIDQDWYEQQYPPEGAEVEFIGELEPLPYIFSSIVVDGVTNKLLSFVKIEDLNENFAYTDAQGNFTIEGQFIPGQIQELIVTSNSVNPAYEVLTVPITTQAGNLRNDINFIPLYSTNSNTDAAILKTKSTSDSIKDNLKEDQKRDFIASTVKRAIDEIQNRLYPFIINKLLTEPFGIGDPIELIKQAKDLSKIKEKRKFNKQVAKGLESGMTLESEGIGLDKPDNIVQDFTFDFDSTYSDFDLTVPSSDIYGCTDPKATNYNPDATIDDNSCVYPPPGDTPTKKIKKIKNKGPKRKFKIKYPKPKGTILKRGGKFRKGGNRRSRNKKINFSGRRRF